MRLFVDMSKAEQNIVFIAIHTGGSYFKTTTQARIKHAWRSLWQLSF